MASTTRRSPAPYIAVAVTTVIAVIAVVLAVSGVLSSRVEGAAKPAAAASGSQAPGSEAQTEDGSSAERFIVSYKQDSQTAQALSSLKADGSNVLDLLPPEVKTTITTAASKVSVKVEQVSAHTLGMASVHLSDKLTAEQVLTFIEDLGAAADVEAVEPDLHVTSLDENVPNDEHFGRQWDLTSAPAGMNVTNAWSQSRGAGVTVAVIDSGILSHPDLEGQVLPGYDFISEPFVAGDNDGRDANPADEGDFFADDECKAGMRGRPSSWHGTHVAGTIAATTNNGTGVSGVAPDARILPVRALGRCGGLSSDILDAITWASGGKVTGVPDNPNPAKIINMSLGGNRTCPVYYQRAIDAAVGRGAIVVAAAGNDAIDAAGAAPASCNNVVTVGASTNTGERAVYSNYGQTIEVSAPGGYLDEFDQSGGILSLGDVSETTPQGSAYLYMMGTSQAAPHVSGTLALLASLDPTLDTTRATQLLQNTSTPMTCDTSWCGTGIVNATSAVTELSRQRSGGEPQPAPEPPAETAPPAQPAPQPEATKKPIKQRLRDLLEKIKDKKDDKVLEEKGQ